MIGFMTYKDTKMGEEFVEYGKGYVITPCYEGPRCRIIFDSGFSIYSQSGRRLEKLEEAWGDLLSKIPVTTPFFLEGELMVANEEEPFTANNSILYVMDYVSTPTLSYYQRSLQRKSFFLKNEELLRDSHIRNTEEGYEIVRDKHSVLLCLDSFYQLGHDSIVLRDTSAPYAAGPSGRLFLVKDNSRLNLRIKEITVKSGELTNVTAEDKEGTQVSLVVKEGSELYNEMVFDAEGFIGKTAGVYCSDNTFELLTVKFTTKKIDRIKGGTV